MTSDFFFFQGVKYVQAFAKGVDFKNKQISCIDLYEHYADFEDDVKLPRNEFKLDYDKLVLAVGTKSNTFKVRWHSRFEF